MEGEEEEETIMLRVVDQNGAEIHFKVKKSTLMQRVLESYCTKMGIAPASVRLLFDGERIVAGDTPESLDMDNGDVIDAVAQQTGGGIDHYNCAICGEIFADVEDHRSCEGCDASWCKWCYDTNESFWYGDEVFCDICFCPGPEDDDIFEYALKLLGKSKSELREELEQTPKYKKRQRTYECLENKEHGCTGTCNTVDESFYDDENEKRRGVCCRARLGEWEWCSECLSGETALKKLKSVR